MWPPNSQYPAELVTLTEKNLSGKRFVQYASKYLKSDRKIRKRSPVYALFVIHFKTTTKIDFEYC